MSQCYYYAHFTDEESEAQKRSSNLLKITKLVNAAARI